MPVAHRLSFSPPLLPWNNHNLCLWSVKAARTWRRKKKAEKCQKPFAFCRKEVKHWYSSNVYPILSLRFPSARIYILS